MVEVTLDETCPPENVKKFKDFNVCIQADVKMKTGI